jgi:cytochrome c oxidase assembly protein Cox11
MYHKLASSRDISYFNIFVCWNSSARGHDQSRMNQEAIAMRVATSVVESLAVAFPNVRLYDWFMSLDTGHTGRLKARQLQKGIMELNSTILTHHIHVFVDMVTDRSPDRHVCFGE